MEKSEYGVNYIQHLNDAFSKIAEDDFLNPSHVSLYVSLFQCWNLRRFQNPFIIQRDEIMLLSKVKSKSTYHRCIKDLEKRGYIKYIPSRNAMTGSKILMLNFRQKSKVKNENTSPKNELPIGQASPKNELPIGLVNPRNELLTGHQRPKNELPIEPLYKHINNIKHINYINTKNQNLESSKKNIIPSLDHLIEFFKENKIPETEAQKFFNYYESNGWKIGGRTPMKNWRAAAKNWMLNVEKFNPITKAAQQTDNLHTNQDKDYTIPL